MRVVRFGTPSGNVWLAQDDEGSVACAESKEIAKARASKPSAVGFDVLMNWQLPVAREVRGELRTPMLIVGANNWIRERVPFFILQSFDIHLVFYPSSEGHWQAGAWLLSRTSETMEPVEVRVTGSKCIVETLTELARHLVLPTSEAGAVTLQDKAVNPKISVWLAHWIYRLPKIALKDVLSLEPFKRGEK